MLQASRLVPPTQFKPEIRTAKSLFRSILRTTLGESILCERHGISQKAVAIQFPLGHPAVQTVLTGCRSVDEVNENVEAFQTPIPAAAWQDLKAEGLLAAGAPVP